MIHTFRFTEKMEEALDKNKRILSVLSDTPVEDITDTAVINFCLHRCCKDYNSYLDE